MNVRKMIRVLNVAEKNDAAKGIAHFLSNGRAQRRETFSKFNKMYEFDLHVQLFGSNLLKMTVTSVSGHLLQTEFPPSHRQWQAVPILSLFEAPIQKFCEANMEPIKRTLEQEAKRAEHLIIWTDCDREGENIGFEVIDVCTKANRRLVVHRAKFSEITKAGINRAIRTLVPPDKKISDAVECRRELDLRIGAAFTRFQTLLAQREFPAKLQRTLLSYGSCQFPTLGFVVERYKSAQDFVVEPFWKLFVKHTKCDLLVEFLWSRVKVFDKQVCETLLIICREKPLATVEKVTTKPKTKRRPVALETIVLEKSASRKLHIPAKRTMDIAQRLYTKGYISYPRTETNRFPKEINLRSLVELQVPDNQWGAFAQGLLDNGIDPHNGHKSDEAHPPIHPIRYAAPQELQGDDRRVYEFIVRHFLACLSSDAQGKETTVDIDVNREKFTASGLIIIARNYLDVYPYDFWSDKLLPEYADGEQFQPDIIDMAEGQTTAPPLLTEADLIALMEKHGIGTDATHAEHIETIKDRRYVALNENQRFVPGYLGLGLVEGYDAMGYSMAKPNLRRELENDLKCICDGSKQADVVLREQITKYRQTFERAYAESRRLVDALASYFGVHRRPNAAAPPGGGIPGNLGGGNHGNNNDEDDDDNPPPAPPGGGLLTNRNGIGQNGYHGNVGVVGGSCGNDPPPDIEQDVSIFCNCNCQAVLRTVRKSGPNEGRQFYCCPKGQDDNSNCRFFTWADTETSGGDLKNQENAGGAAVDRVYSNNRQCNGVGPVNEISIFCYCNVPAVERTVRKTGPNEGRQFYGCSKSIDDGRCDFFKWAEDAKPEDAGGATSGPSNNRPFNPPSTILDVSIFCSCNIPAVERTVRKPGPNFGRQFYCCAKLPDDGKCGFFQWTDDVTTTARDGRTDDDAGGAASNVRETFPSNKRPVNNNVNHTAANGNVSIFCLCNIPAVERTVRKTGPNEGRLFFCCSKPQDDSSNCRFFKWTDDITSSRDDENGPGGATSARRRFSPDPSRESNARRGGYRTGGAARGGRGKFSSNTRLSVNSNGVNTNADDLFPTQIRFNERGQQQTTRKSGGKKLGRGNGRSSGSGEGRKCSVCRQTGHTARNCPQNV